MTKLSMLAAQHRCCLEGFRDDAMVNAEHFLFHMQNDNITRLLAAAAKIEGRAEQLETENEYLRGLVKERVETDAKDMLGVVNES